MAKVYWVGSIEPVWHAGLQRFVARGTAVDAELVDDDGRWHKTKPRGAHPFAEDAAPGEEQPDVAEEKAAPQEVKTDG